MLTILNYGLGNVSAFKNIFQRLGLDCEIASTESALQRASKIILPGVGSFDWAMTLLNESGMRECLDKLVVEKEVPILGVCVGMQILANKSEEGKEEGLGWIDATVRKFDIQESSELLQLPHMGWNKIAIHRDDSLLEGLNSESEFYFLHSYYFLPSTMDDVVTKSSYGIEFASSVKRRNIYGTQFHPEKSHGSGIQLLNNFSKLEF